jgi:GT2 family glycosyltransferase
MIDSTPSASATLAGLNAVPRPVLDDISVVVPTMGRPTLEQCLRAIVQGTCWPARLIVIDQGTNAQVGAWLGHLEALGIATLHLRAEPRGPGAARNRGFELVQTRFFAAIDDDCVAEPTWLEHMARHLRQHPHAIITGRVNPGGEGFVPSVVAFDSPVTYDRLALSGVAAFVSGNIGMVASTSQLIGPFDEDPLLSAAAEDNELGYRALRAGVPIMYRPDVIVAHMDWRDTSQLPALYRGYARGQGAFFGKYLRQGDWTVALWVLLYVYRGIRLWVRGLLCSDQHAMIEGAARMQHFVPGLLAGLRSRTPAHAAKQTAGGASG